MSTAPSPTSPFFGRQRSSANSHFARPSSPILRLAETRAALRNDQFCQKSPPRGYPCTLMPNGIQAQPTKQPRGAVGTSATFTVFHPSTPRGTLISVGPSTATATAQLPTTPSNISGQLTGSQPSVAIKSQATRSSVPTERRPRPGPIAVTEGSFRSSGPQITFCTVCAATETPEWRKGPAGIRSLCNGCGLLAAKRQRDRGVLYGPSGFSSVESILEELEQIGRERFKVKGGRYHLPPGVIQRVIDMVENPATPNTPLERGGTTRRPRSSIKRGSSGDEVQVASGVGGVVRRASTSNASAPAPQGMSGATMRAPPTIRQRRSGSLGSAHSGYPSNVGDATVHAFPPSSSYMNALGRGGGGVSPAPAFGFGVQLAPSQSSCSARSWLTATRPMSAPGAVARGAGVPPPPFLLGRHPSPPSSSLGERPMSALAASANRMSIHHLTSASARMRETRSPPRFEMPKRANALHTSVPTSALRRSTATSFGPAGAACARPSAARDVASHTRKPTT